VSTQGLRAEQYLSPETLAQLAPFELRAKMVADGVMNGMHQSPLQGMAVEFAAHRQYTAGDSIRHLDWKVFGRSDKLYVKEYRQETNLDVMILVDGSASMSFGTLGVKQGWGGTDATRQRGAWTKFDHATASAAALAFLCLSQRDRVGVAVGADGLRGAVRKSAARDQWRSIVRCLSSEPVEARFSPAACVNQLLAQTSHRTLFVILSDFLGDPEGLRTALARLRHRGHDAMLLAMLDHRELTLDLDVEAPFIGLEGEEALDVDTRTIRKAYLDELQRHLQGIDRQARAFGYDLQVFDTHESVGPVLAALLSRREGMVAGGRR
jgi:uncharacterized protein (DUF58 family)